MRAFVFHDSLLQAQSSLPVGTVQLDQCKSMSTAEESEWPTKCGLLVLFSHLKGLVRRSSTCMSYHRGRGMAGVTWQVREWWGLQGPYKEDSCCYPAGTMPDIARDSDLSRDARKPGFHVNSPTC